VGRSGRQSGAVSFKLRRDRSRIEVASPNPCLVVQVPLKAGEHSADFLRSPGFGDRVRFIGTRNMSGGSLTEIALSATVAT
jgi:hypothetical protein